MRILCGLGNPGKQYENTRHNIGFRFIDELASKHNFTSFQDKWDVKFSEGSFLGEKTLLIKPQTFMNLSGKALAHFIHFYKVPLDKIVVIYDDVDLELGEFKFRKKGSAGTHNGMKSIIENLGSQNFPRLRIGIESRGLHSPKEMELSDFVLAPFAPEESEILNNSIQNAMIELEKSLAS